MGVTSVELAATMLAPDLPADLIADLTHVHLAGEAEPLLLSEKNRNALARHRVIGLVDEHARRPVAMLRLQLIAESKRVTAALADVGIETRLLKGIATGELDYPRHLQRHTGDVDLLVRPTDFVRAEAELLRLGYRQHPLPMLGHSFRKGTTLVSERGIEIDVHTRLNSYVQADPNILFDRPTRLPGSAGLALPTELRLVHAASHLLITPPGLRRVSGLVDISLILDLNTPDLALTRSLARRLNVESITGAALHAEAILYGRDVSYRDWAQPSALEKLAFVRTRRNLAAEHAYAMSQLPTMAQRALYLRDWLPTREFLRERGGARSYFGKLFDR